MAKDCNLCSLRVISRGQAWGKIPLTPTLLHACAEAVDSPLDTGLASSSDVRYRSEVCGDPKCTLPSARAAKCSGGQLGGRRRGVGIQVASKQACHIDFSL